MWLLPGPSSGAVSLAAATLGIGAFGMALWSTGHQPMSLGVTLAGGAVAALILGKREGPTLRSGAREVPMAVTPWGIIVDPDVEPRVLRWPAIRRIHVDVAHTLSGGTPAVLSSLVTIETDRDLLAGRSFGSANLEGLTVHLDAYAEEAARPPSLDLDGFEPAQEGTPEPCFAALVRVAEELCSSGQGAARLSLPTGGYRTIANRAAAPETLEGLRMALGSSSDAIADPRPLAAIVAVKLGAKSLVPDLLRLVSSPHPLTAAIAKAAAVRLGAPPNRAGAVEEVADFLFAEDFDKIVDWAGA